MSKKDLLPYVLSLLTFISSLVFYNLWQENLELSLNPRSVAYAGLGLIVYTSCLNLLFLTNRIFPALVFGSLSPILSLYTYSNLLPHLIVAILLTGLALIWAYFDLSKGLNLFKKLDVERLWPSRAIVSALILSLSVLVVGKYSQPSRDLSIKIPEEVFDSASKFSTNLIGGGKDQSTSAPSLLEEAFEKEIPNLRKQISKAGITDEDEIIANIEEAKRAFLSQTETSFSADQFNNLLADQLKTVKVSLEKQLNDLLRPYRSFLPIGAGLVFYLTLSFLSPLLATLSSFLSFLIFKLLLVLKLFSIKKRNEEVEFLEI